MGIRAIETKDRDALPDARNQLVAGAFGIKMPLYAPGFVSSALETSSLEKRIASKRTNSHSTRSRTTRLCMVRNRPSIGGQVLFSF